MPRQPRIVVPGQPLHMLQRGNNRQPMFFAEEDYRRFLDTLKDACDRYGCLIHAYVLMTNHVHILATPGDEASVSRVMQSVGRRYVRYVNDTYHRTGTLWEGRFKCSLIDTQAYLLRCFVYIEMNPVRAGMAAAPRGYRWSSHRANAFGDSDPLLTPHELYQELGADAAARREAYKALFSCGLGRQATEEIRKAVESDLPLGNVIFRKEVERTLGRRVNRHTHGGDRRSRQFSRRFSRGQST